jgi:hypothetical protein
VGPRMPYRRRSNRGTFRRARTFVRKVVRSMGPIEAKRILLDSLTIPSDAGSDYNTTLEVPLIVCQESVDEEIESNGTNIAQVPPYSKVVSMKGQYTVHGLSSGTIIRWHLRKFPDGESLFNTLIDAAFHTSDDTPTAREARAMTLAKGIIVGSDRTAGRLNVFVRRNTLQRLGNLRENDRLVLILAQNTTNPCQLTGFGTVYVRLN